jgi:hypothetical protein
MKLTVITNIGKNNKVGIDFFAAVWQTKPPPVMYKKRVNLLNSLKKVPYII